MVVNTVEVVGVVTTEEVEQLTDIGLVLAEVVLVDCD
jgi:hypothetical protein